METNTAVGAKLRSSWKVALEWRHAFAISVIVLTLIVQWFIVGKYAWWNVAGSVPPMFMILIPIATALMAIRAKRKWIMFVYALLLFLLWMPRMDINLAAPINAMKGTEEQGLKVMSWNTYLWDQHDGEADMYAFMREKEQDIYILNEYEYSENWNPYLIDRYDEIVANFPDYEVITNDQYVIISKYPVISHELGETKQVMMAKLQVGDKELAIIDVHLRPHVDLGHSLISPIFWDYVAERHAHRMKGFAEIRQFAEQEKDNAVIVTGDLNATVLMNDFDDVIGPMNDAVKHSTSLFPTSWKRTGGSYWWRIDHFMYNDNIELHSYETDLDEELSDHKAILVQLTLK